VFVGRTFYPPYAQQETVSPADVAKTSDLTVLEAAQA
jgi:hypothetical protein